jgi:hypothetical protein
MQPIPFPKTSGAWIIVRNLRLVDVAGTGSCGLTTAVYDYWKKQGGWCRGGSRSMRFEDKDAAALYIKQHRTELASAS